MSNVSKKYLFENLWKIHSYGEIGHSDTYPAVGSFRPRELSLPRKVFELLQIDDKS